MCLVLILVCSMSISAFAVNDTSQASEQTSQEQRKEEAVEKEMSLSTQEKEKASESTTKNPLESQTKKEEETQEANSAETTEVEKTTEKEQKAESKTEAEAKEKASETEKDSETETEASETTTKSEEKKEEKKTQETYDVNVIFEDTYSGGAAIYYLANPAGDPWTNDTGAWAPAQESSETVGKINVSGAVWEDGYVGSTTYKNKNIKSNVARYITAWPDSSTGSSWTVKRDDENTKDYFTFVLNSIWDSYKSSIAKELGIDANRLQKEDITEISLIPRKISRDNGGTYPYHIDCALNIKSKSVFTAKFWVKNPGESEYTQVDAKNYLTGKSVEKTAKATIGSTKVENGITYILDGWYPENSSGGAYGATKIGENSWNYSPSESELADGTVNFYAHYTPTTTSVKLKKLVTGSMGDRKKKFHFIISIIKDGKNATFKIGADSKTGQAETELSDKEEVILTAIPVGATVTITEDDYSATRYTTSYTIDDTASSLARRAEVTAIQAKEDVSAHEVTFTNNKEAIPDTGITSDSLPFITLFTLSIMGIAGYLFIRYRKRFI